MATYVRAVPLRLSDTHLLGLGQDANATAQSGLCLSEATTTFDLLVGQTTSTSILKVFVSGVAAYLWNISDSLLSRLRGQIELVGTGDSLKGKRSIITHSLCGQEHGTWVCESESVQCGVEEMSGNNQSVCSIAYEAGRHALIKQWRGGGRKAWAGHGEHVLERGRCKHSIRLRLDGHSWDTASNIEEWLDRGILGA
jgi:hypothetical protein